MQSSSLLTRSNPYSYPYRLEFPPSSVTIGVWPRTPTVANPELDRDYVYAALRKLALFAKVLEAHSPCIEEWWRRAYIRSCQLNREIQQHMRLYIAAQSKAWSGRMQNKLPRELRDMVYDFLLEHDDKSPSIDVELVPKGVSNTEYKLKAPFHADFPGAPSANGIRHLDPAAKLEYAEAWYRTLTFGIVVNRNHYMLDGVMWSRARNYIVSSSDLNDFLHRDVWGLGFTPRNHLRHFEVRFYMYEITTVPDMENIVGMLFALSTSTEITVRFKTPWYGMNEYHQRIRRLFTYTPRICLILQRLAHTGYKMTLELDEGIYVKPQPGDFVEVQRVWEEAIERQWRKLQELPRRSQNSREGSRAPRRINLRHIAPHGG